MPDTSSRRFVLSGLLLCFFFSGAAGLIYQVAWSKALGLIFGHTAYAVATVLAVFMGGLAAGSAWLKGRDSQEGKRKTSLTLTGLFMEGVDGSGAYFTAHEGYYRSLTGVDESHYRTKRPARVAVDTKGRRRLVFGAKRNPETEVPF